jgi:hypothetical protein
MAVQTGLSEIAGAKCDDPVLGGAHVQVIGNVVRR